MTCSFDIEIAARTVYGEARGENSDTQLAVAWVLRNRSEAGAWYSGRTLAECCAMHAGGSQYGQFSCWNVDDPNYVQIFRVADNDPVLAQCRGAINTALGGDPEADPTQGATHYCNLGVVTPKWIDTATRTATIGKLTFFKNVV